MRPGNYRFIKTTPDSGIKGGLKTLVSTNLQVTTPALWGWEL